MQYIIIAFIIVGLTVVWIFFRTMATNQKQREEEEKKKIEEANQRKKEILNAVIEEEKRQLKKSQMAQKKEVFYQLNTHEIKLNLYPKSYFGDFRIFRLYREIVIDNYWLNEPFHTEFSRLLQFIGSNKFWLKDPKSREVISNIRDDNNQICKNISMYVLDLIDVLDSVIKKVYSELINKELLTKKDLQNSILSASIYVLSESGDISSISKTLRFKYVEKKDLQYALVDIICTNLSVKTKMMIVENNFLNDIFFTKIYNEILFNFYAHLYTFPVNGEPSRTINLLPYPPKKQLMSIAKSTDMFF